MVLKSPLEKIARTHEPEKEDGGNDGDAPAAPPRIFRKAATAVIPVFIPYW
jgi:hypothetical protein